VLNIQLATFWTGSKHRERSQKGRKGSAAWQAGFKKPHSSSELSEVVVDITIVNGLVSRTRSLSAYSSTSDRPFLFNTDRLPRHNMEGLADFDGTTSFPERTPAPYLTNCQAACFVRKSRFTTRYNDLQGANHRCCVHRCFVSGPPTPGL
jgi:hypothetical protein